ncbi:MAG: peptide deformylase [Beggiatoa sp. IS2]|nr:MAG: peptide deformylase [Beggiatoa sp. IS2]
MALLPILHFPDPRLRIIAQPVQQVGEKERQIIANMLETMYDAHGIGLAATQVNIHQQMIVIDVSIDKSQWLCLVNPKIIHSEGVSCFDEGCLSVPGVYESIERAERITVNALNQEGESTTFVAEGILATCIQHEMDHLKGKLFVDYLSPLKRQRIRKRLGKQQDSQVD